MGEFFPFLLWRGGCGSGRERDVLTCLCVGSRRIRRGDLMAGSGKSGGDIYGRRMPG